MKIYYYLHFFQNTIKIYNTLDSRRSALKKAARIIVQKQYTLLKPEVADLGAWAESIALKVKHLLDDSGPLTMVCTDSPLAIDEHVSD
jgi:hypothetical protein